MNAENHRHERYEELADRALDGTLSAEETADLEHHLRDCETCAELVRVVQTTAKAWREAPDDQLPDAVRDAVGERLMSEIAGEAAAAPRTPEQGKVTWLRVAAVAVPLAAAAAIAIVIAWPDPLEEPAPTAPQLAEDVDTGADVEPAPTARSIASPVQLAGTATVTSPDGKPVPVTDDVRFRAGDVVTLGEGAELGMEIEGAARLHLAAGAVLRLDADDSGVELDLRRGSVAARVEPRDEGQEFQVTTPAGTVEVTATIFRVQVASTAEVAVEVVEGKVLVRDRADERNVVAVEAGQTLALDWSAPDTERLADESRAEIMALFGMELRGESEQETAVQTGSGSGRGKWETLFDEAQQLRKDKRVAEALAIYERIADKAPGKKVRAEASFTMGQLRYSSGDSAGAERDFARHLDLHGKSPYHEMSLYYLAKSRIKLGRWQPALESLRALTEAHPSGARAAEAHYYIGSILAKRMKDCPAAVRSLDRFIKMAPSHKRAPQARELRDQCRAPTGN